MQEKIFGGEYSKIDDYPHAVFLVLFGHYCGGSIVNQLIVLTAAHCLERASTENLERDPISVYSGHNNIDKADLKLSKHFVKHEDYRPPNVANDVGLVFLDQPLLLGPKVKRILLGRNFPIHVSVAVVAGWGETNDLRGTTNILLKSVEQKIIDLDKCSNSRYFRAGMMCAGDSLENRPSRGDSGSGLVTSNNVQIGLVSFRANTAKSMTFYSNVSYFFDWILQTANHNCAPLVRQDDVEREEHSIVLRKFQTYNKSSM